MEVGREINKTERGKPNDARIRRLEDKSDIFVCGWVPNLISF